MFFVLHLRANILEVISLEEGDYQGRHVLAYLEECAWGPEDHAVVTASPCHTLYVFLLGEAKDHRVFSAIWACMSPLPLNKGGLSMLFTEIGQFVHRGHTKVDHNGVGI